MLKKEIAIKHATILAAFLLIVWGFYRFLFKMPEEVEELLIKPLIWLVPVYFLVKKEKLGLSSLGVTSKKLFPAIYLALGLGILFAIEGVIVNFVKHGGINFSANLGSKTMFLSLGLSFATAVSEEIAFRGYLFNRVWHAIDNEWRANVITSLVWATIHAPIAIFWLELNWTGILGYLLLTTIFGIGSAYVFARTKNVVSSILLHVLWEWPIVLFR
jgi:membrane protease YdiL (CAAX protease family)